ncbi:MAG: hypothetical protein QXR45_12260 [Candidatus Bathyarchaeia archaeon]
MPRLLNKDIISFVNYALRAKKGYASTITFNKRFYVSIFKVKKTLYVCLFDREKNGFIRKRKFLIDQVDRKMSSIIKLVKNYKKLVS